jgi:xanthine dehydrogenase accessory factor
LTKLRTVFTLNDLQVEDRSIQDVQKRRLVIVGNEEVALALAKLGKLLKFHVTVIDPLLTGQNLPEADFILNELDLPKAGVTENTFVVIASRGRFDEEALEQALNTPAKYVALVGKKKRGTELLQRLRSGGVSEPALSRVRCPAGLEIRASSPEEIALSVLAEIISLNS